MVAPGSPTMIAGSLSSFIGGFHQSCRFSQSSGPRRSCVGIGLALLLALEVAAIGRATADRHGSARIDPEDERDGGPSCVTTRRILPLWTCSLSGLSVSTCSMRSLGRGSALYDP